MFVPFLIMFREGLEAALIVSLIASYLNRTQRGQWMGAVWIGVVTAVALCLAVGIFINETTGEFPQKQQELFEGIIAVVAVCILTYMVFWMRKVSKSVKAHLEGAIDNALNPNSEQGRGRGQGWALVVMVFFAVAREGLESVFFLLAAFQQDVGIGAPIGAILGLTCAILVGMAIYWGGVKLHLAKFFKWTSLFILFVAAGLAAGAIRAFHEAGLWNHFQDLAFDLTNVLSTHSLFGTFLEGMFGYQEAPTVSEVAVYFIYLIPALILFFLPPRTTTVSAVPDAQKINQ
ncbi:iron uptake transporter permease EfeU [Yersinia pekkanenii]|uniref:Ferrous iron transport permease EfeU n=1 Tax=Yersinia pekkanenii TaxID=1288385 RepID=A0A0T9NXB9_9GAMM|nr:iron uptake transporter permease EfeU [Yersinia pekkanenii]CNH34861.1 ferrous iron transport permease EfeU [Yersinia pekkanenii]CRY65326.1 ferrous iron transport permease EfeU [Yersinia pekkanenii]